MAFYRLHDNQAVREIYENAFMLNNIVYDHNGEFIHKIRLEILYPAYVLLNSKADETKPKMICPNLKDLPTSYEETLQFNNPVILNGELYPYGICLFNLWCGFSKIKISKHIKPTEISKIIYKDSNSNQEYHERLCELEKNLFWYVSTHPTESLTLSLDEISKLNIGQHRKLFEKLPYNPHIGQHLYEAITHRVYDDIPETDHLKKFTKIKIQRTQLSRMIGAIGYIADDKNIVNSKPLTQSIFNGLDKETFFLTAIGTRKGIVDKSRATPAAGYLERSMVINLSPVELDMEDCGTELRLPIKVMSTGHVRSLIGKWYYDYNKGKDILYNPKEHEWSSEIGKTYNFRSPIICANPNFKICRKCFGKYNLPTPNVGILSGQYNAERLTQLSMRTFHTSGSCTLPTDNEVVDLMYKHLIDIDPKVAIRDSGGSTFALDVKLTDTQAKKFSAIPGWFETKFDGKYTLITYKNLYNVMNKDVTEVIRNVEMLLKRQDKKNMMSVIDVYNEYIHNILDVGQIYSAFVEIILCNMYLTKDKTILRYAAQTNPGAVATSKLSIRKLHTVVSRLLGLLYEPNEISIGTYSSLNPLQQQGETILERVWNNSIT